MVVGDPSVADLEVGFRVDDSAEVVTGLSATGVREVKFLVVCNPSVANFKVGCTVDASADLVTGLAAAPVKFVEMLTGESGTEFSVMLTVPLSRTDRRQKDHVPVVEDSWVPATFLEALTAEAGAVVSAALTEPLPAAGRLQKNHEPPVIEGTRLTEVTDGVDGGQIGRAHV